MPIVQPRFKIKILLEILGNFEVDKVSSIREIKVGTDSNIKYKVFSSDAEYFLKGIPKNELNFSRKKSSHRFQREARALGLPVPNLKSSIDGSTVYCRDNFLWELQSWVKGERSEIDEGKAKDIGFLLSKIHEVGREMNGDSFRRIDILESFSRVYSNFNLLKENSVLSSEISGLLEYHIDRLYSEIKKIDIKTLPFVLAHGDFHRGNVLFLNNSLASVLDFDLVSFQPRINEIANAMLQFSLIKEGVEGEACPARLRGSVIKALAFGYRKEKEVSLREEEIAGIPSLISYNLLIESFSLMGKHKYKRGVGLIEAALRLLKWLEPRSEKIISLIK